MFGAAIILLSLSIAIKYEKLGFYAAYTFFCYTLIALAGLEGIEAAFQINIKPSDTHLYYTGYNSPWEYISDYLFYYYPASLKLLTHPFDNIYYALVVQCAFMAFAIIWSLRKSNSMFYCLVLISHTVIYLSVNLFKDNYFLIVCLLAIGVVSRLKSKFVSSIAILTSIWAMMLVRPFAFLFLPLSGTPFVFTNASKWLKIIFWGGSIIAMGAILVTQWGVIMYVASSWSDEASVGTSGISIASLPKVILGPTPFHYFYHKDHFVQPFLDSQAVVLTFLHYVYYAALTWFIVVLPKNIKSWYQSVFQSPAAVFAFALGMAILVIYMVAYGSADVRQRAIILTLLFLSISLPFTEQNKPFDTSLTAIETSAFVGIFGLLFVVSLFAI
ncbi:hypothetical protein [Thalassotalea marina]|uniref:Uncharacterized protein n=1 Tax=Thalassotalea marina TaxID=1673741 RepID=A0A919BBK3_9GAMM|nr:hypothetical protein [Thalassotalea marina]GHF80955.1 hypothetical protein GCM10017161_05340 [Thalassotalea marina]